MPLLGDDPYEAVPHHGNRFRGDDGDEYYWNFADRGTHIEQDFPRLRKKFANLVRMDQIEHRGQQYVIQLWHSASYPEVLLNTAQSLITDNEFSISLVVAHIACEISAERALSRAFAAKGIEYLEGSVGDLLPGYNLANDRVRSVYNAITGNQIEKLSFWRAFKESVGRRNQVVHKGKIFGKAEAEASLKAASALVAFLK